MEPMEVDPEDHEDDYIVHIVFPSHSVTLTVSDGIAMCMFELRAQEIARSILISEQSNNNVPTLAELVKFAKKTPTARPARIFKPFAGYIKSVGCLVCGRIQATCFLVGGNVVMTSNHVMNMITEARHNASDQNNKNAHAAIYIYFDYLHPRRVTQEPLPRVEVDETKMIYRNSLLDYVFLGVKENDVLRDRTPLGPIVRNRIPKSGIVTIIGHPGGGELLGDACPIISSSHQSNISGLLNSSAQKKAKDCVENPLSCSNNNAFAKCVHSVMLAYHTTCMFEGSSGSPVFNEDGNMVAIHTYGHTIHDKGKTTNIMEFGVSFAAIFEDVKSNLGEKIANEYFPNCR